MRRDVVNQFLIWFICAHILTVDHCRHVCGWIIQCEWWVIEWYLVNLIFLYLHCSWMIEAKPTCPEIFQSRTNLKSTNNWHWGYLNISKLFTTYYSLSCYRYRRNALEFRRYLLHTAAAGKLLRVHLKSLTSFIQVFDLVFFIKWVYKSSMPTKRVKNCFVTYFWGRLNERFDPTESRFCIKSSCID